VIRILVIDDHPVVREGLVASLEDDPEFQVVGAAGSLDEALPQVTARRPDVILLDLELPRVDGLSAIPILGAAHTDARILILTAYDTDERVLGAIRGGAKGYLLKGAPLSEIARAIRAVHAGETYLEPRIASKIVAELGPGRKTGALSRREREVLRLVAGGQSNKQIAQALGITERTVKFHVASVMNKLGAENRAQAVALAGRRGLI
jgi:two-component system, NarL family, response regulator LiaR